MSSERGRPRSFDKDAALDRALDVFWRHGFQGASLSELTEAMGLNKPSLYAAFGDKEALYLKALDRYAALCAGEHVAKLNAEPDGRRAVAGFLHSLADMLANPKYPGGCCIINGMADCGGVTTPPAVEEALRKAMQGNEALLKARITRAQNEGQLPKNVSSDALAALFSTLIAGLAVFAKGGASRATLDKTIDAAMAVWPEPVAAIHPAAS